MFVLSLCAAAYLGFALIHLGHDKAVHFVTFFILTAEFYFLWYRHRPWKLTFIVMTLGASISLEYAQGIVNPNRVFDAMDIVYNVHGSGLALILCCVCQSAMPRQRRAPAPELEIQALSVSPDTSEDEVEGYVNVHMRDMR